jgi:ATP-dependent DNA helicase RecG
MDWLELAERIRKGENLHTEFKQGPVHPDDLAAELVAFANTDGGWLIFGVTDNRELLGIEDPDRLAQQVDHVAYQNCEPPLTVVQETVTTPEGKTLLVVRVPKGDLRPYRTRRGDYFIRTSSGKRRASRQELLRLFQAAESFFYEETLVLQATLTDLDLEAFREFRERVVGDVSADDRQLLLNWKLVRGYEGSLYPTVAAVLLFGRDPQRFIPYAYVSAARIPGEDTANEPSDVKRIEGKLFTILEDTARFLYLHLQIPHEIQGFRPEAKPELPEAALREVVVNALVHRDYTIHAPVRVFILDDRVEVRSPGTLPNTVTIEMVKSGIAHVLRNPLLYTFFYRAGFVTDTGNGFRRVIEYVRKSVGREPDIREEGNETVVSLPRRLTRGI